MVLMQVLVLEKLNVDGAMFDLRHCTMKELGSQCMIYWFGNYQKYVLGSKCAECCSSSNNAFKGLYVSV